MINRGTPILALTLSGGRDYMGGLGCWGCVDTHDIDVALMCYTSKDAQVSVVSSEARNLSVRNSVRNVEAIQ